MSDNIFYVYQYLTEENIPFYIGKGSKNRINESHLPWIEVPPIEFRQIIAENLTEKEAYDIELELIKKYGRKVDGGILENIKVNRWSCKSGWKHSEETKQMISEKNTGKIRTDEQKKNYKKPKSKEHAEKIRQANIGRKDDADRREKNRQASLRPEVRAAKSEKMKQIIANKKANGLSWPSKKVGDLA